MNKPLAAFALSSFWLFLFFIPCRNTLAQLDYRDERLTSGESVINTSLPKRFIIKGTVRDRDGKSIDDFTVVPGYDLYRGVQWEQQRIFRGRSGQFRLPLEGTIPNYLKVRASGFLPSVSPRFSGEEGELNLNFEMKKGGLFSGTVLFEDQPVAAADVALLTESSEVAVGQGSLIRTPSSLLFRTDTRGRFNVPMDPEAHSLIIVHKNGFAEVPIEELADSPKISLRPWSRLEATLMSPDRQSRSTLALITAETLLPNSYRGLHQGNWTLDFNTFAQETTANATISFAFLPPGERVFWQAVVIDESSGDSPGNLSFVGRRFMARAGETVRIQPGEKEMFQIKGRVVADRSMEWNTRLGLLRLKTAVGENREIALTFSAEGNFRIVGLPDNISEMELSLYEPPLLLGVARIPIPNENAGRVNGCLDVGTVTVLPVQVTGLGQTAPDFEVAGLDDQPIRLNDYRGKYVLVEFWSSRCQPSVSSVPYLAATHEAYGSKGRLVVIGLNLDGDRETARRFAARLHMKWPQGYLGHWLRTPLPARFGAASLPAAFLIDPAGRLVHSNLAGPDIGKTVEQALK